MIVNGIEELVGKTPLVRLNRIEKRIGSCAEILAKIESFNPAGSAKDRVALQMILDAEENGQLLPGGIIVEPTSGNTGIGLAAIGSARGYRVILTMPDTMSVERRLLLSALGAQIHLTDGKLGMSGAIEEAERIASETGAFLPGQFSSPSNSKAHESTTGPEILRDTEGRVDLFVACVGTGGTITGVGHALKKECPTVRIVAVEPKGSPVLSGGKGGPHGIQGIGAGFIPEVLDTEIYDEIYCATEEEAYEAARLLAKTEGLAVGISSGAALACAMQYAKKEEWQGKRIVVLLPDTGDRYLSTPLFQ
ncbi:MAG: cysteine synthase A [Clostridia bacterium]|nr:cysteine synthase A [Clostridia bacterium]